MKRYLFSIATIFIATSLLVQEAQAQKQLAFPGAEGFGRFATGGRGGDVYHVTNLNDDGAGSLRYGIEKASGPRTIVFDISGNIFLNDRLKLEKSNITIAGQTAPGDGITLAGQAFYVEANNVIVRYIRCRFGDVSGAESDAVSITGGENIIFDHVTASWSVDETFSCQSDNVDLLTVQWCMVTESMRYSIHSKGAHGYGGIIGSTRQSFHHNLYAHHSSRSPKVTGRRHCEVDFRNNVIYNWGYNNCYDGTASYMNWANNYYKSGPGTSSDKRKRIFQLSDEDIADEGSNSPEDSKNFETSLYAEGNYVDGYPAVTADNWNGGIDFMNGASEVKNRAHTPFDFPSITEGTAVDVYPLVVAGAGASLVRDSIDERIANEVLTGTTTYVGSVSGDYGIIDSQNDVGGWPGLATLPALTDTDQDGMPDQWETENGLNPNDQEDRNDDRNSDGYTNLEEYLYRLVPVFGEIKPTVNLVSPVSGTGYLQTDTVFVKAGTNSYGEDSIESIALYLDAELISSFDATEIDTFLTGIPTGPHYISVKAWDQGGNFSMDSSKIYSGSVLLSLSDSIIGEGSVILNPPGGVYVESMEVSVFAKPEFPYHFDTWTGDTSESQNPLLLTMYKDIKLIATFLMDSNTILNINFQPGTSTVPEGYFPDYGYQYGSRSNGQTYGWVGMDNINTRERSYPDLRMATLNHMQKSGNVPWEIKLENGRYNLNIHMGDADYTDQVNSIDVEGIEIVDESIDTGNFDDYHIENVTVGDGNLTLTSMGDNAKINFIRIVKISGNFLIVSRGTGSGEYDPGTVVNITANVPSEGYLFDGWTGDVSHLEDSTASSTSVTMPEGVVAVTAVYKKDATAIFNQPAETKSIFCYPNPATDGFTVELMGMEEAGIEIYNLLGRLVYNSSTNERILHVNDHNLSPGIYLIKAMDANKNIYSQKLIIK